MTDVSPRDAKQQLILELSEQVSNQLDEIDKLKRIIRYKKNRKMQLQCVSAVFKREIQRCKPKLIMLAQTYDFFHAFSTLIPQKIKRRRSALLGTRMR